jgi:hypothetical protein
MFGLIRRRRHDDPADEKSLQRADEPNPAVALAVGLIYVFRTSAGARLMRELEGAVRKYSADPQALWRLVRNGDRGEVIDTTAATPEELPPGPGDEKK